jgi:hypothetical protein
MKRFLQRKLLAGCLKLLFGSKFSSTQNLLSAHNASVRTINTFFFVASTRSLVNRSHHFRFRYRIRSGLSKLLNSKQGIDIAQLFIFSRFITA